MAEPIVKKRTAAKLATRAEVVTLNERLNGVNTWIQGETMSEAQQTEVFNALKRQVENFDTSAAGRLETLEGKVSKIEPNTDDLMQGVIALRGRTDTLRTEMDTAKTTLVDHTEALKNTDENFVALGMEPVATAITRQLTLGEQSSSGDIADFAGKSIKVSITSTGVVYGILENNSNGMIDLPSGGIAASYHNGVVNLMNGGFGCNITLTAV